MTIGTGTVNPLFLARLEVDSLSYFRLGHDYGTAHTHTDIGTFFLSLFSDNAHRRHWSQPSTPGPAASVSEVDLGVLFALA